MASSIKCYVVLPEKKKKHNKKQPQKWAPINHSILQTYCIYGLQGCHWELSNLTQYRSRMPWWHFKQSQNLLFVFHVKNKRPLNLGPAPMVVNGKCSSADLWPLSVALSQCWCCPLADFKCHRAVGTKGHNSGFCSKDFPAEAWAPAATVSLK